MTKRAFYILSITWGLPLTFVGGIAAMVLLACGVKPQRHGGALYFEVGRRNFGFNLGPVFICRKGASDRLKNHEFGHAIQNCYLGPLMPFLVVLPSVARFWYLEWREKRGDQNLPPYDAVWFERQATALGEKHISLF